MTLLLITIAALSMTSLTNCSHKTTSVVIMPSENVIRRIPDSIRATFPDSLKWCEWGMSDSKLMGIYEQNRKLKAELEECKLKK